LREVPVRRGELAVRILPWLMGVFIAGCASQGVGTGPFTQVGRIQTDLQRGVSTKLDVQRVLGTPKGTGSTVLALDPRPREIWYYSDIELTQIRNEGQGVLLGEVRQQVVLVFFREGVLDGFMWWSSSPALWEAR
jgi:hypothetical protein